MIGEYRRDLRGHVGALRRRIWLERATSLGVRFLILGFGLAFVAVVAAWATRTPLEPAYYGGPVAAALGLALLASLFRYPSSMEAARTADHRLALREQLGTAVELARAGADGPIVRRQLQTAADTAGWARGNWRGRGGLGRDGALAAALGLLTAGVLLMTGLENRIPGVIPRPEILADGSAAQPSQSSAAVEAPAPERAAGAAEKPGGGQRGASSSVGRQLDELRRARESGAISPQEASNRLARAEAELDRQSEASRAQREGVDRLGRALDQVAAGRSAAEAIQRGDYDRAGQEIASLGTESDQLSPEAKQQLAQAMRSAAAESGATPELAARERRAAESLAGRDYEAARKAMEELGHEVARRGQDVVPRQDLAQAQDQADRERREQGLPERSASAQSGQQQRGGGQQGQQGQQGGQSGQGQSGGSGAGQEQGGNGGRDGNAGQAGAGNGDGQATGRANGPPSDQGVGEFREAGQATRLDVQGRPVVVDVAPSQRRGARPGEAEGDEDDEQNDEVESISTTSGSAPGRVTGAAPAESNVVPSERRQTVREYFGGSGSGR